MTQDVLHAMAYLEPIDSDLYHSVEYMIKTISAQYHLDGLLIRREK